eukprot:scaffold2011_cov22-Tisochrysis_lutea.AAC.1
MKRVHLRLHLKDLCSKSLMHIPILKSLNQNTQKGHMHAENKENVMGKRRAQGHWHREDVQEQCNGGMHAEHKEDVKEEKIFAQAAQQTASPDFDGMLSNLTRHVHDKTHA